MDATCLGGRRGRAAGVRRRAAHAQYGSSLSRSPIAKGVQEDKKDAKTPEQKKKEESAYKDAVGRIPDQKFDPWGKVR